MRLPPAGPPHSAHLSEMNQRVAPPPAGAILRATDLALRCRRVNRSKQFARRPFRVLPVVRLTPPTLAQLKRQPKPSPGRKPEA
jgi:hypothetical protein